LLLFIVVFIPHTHTRVRVGLLPWQIVHSR
jgi:hypothetical protein